MADNVFPFLFWALGQGFAAGAWPANGAERLTGGSPRYALYRTSDGKVVTAAPLEQKFWETFCDVIELEPELRDDRKDGAATKARVAAIIAGETAQVWRARFSGRDCCCSIVTEVKEATADPHYLARGLFEHKLANAQGTTMPALPLPLDPGFRAPPAQAIAAPALGADNEHYLS